MSDKVFDFKLDSPTILSFVSRNKLYMRIEWIEPEGKSLDEMMRQFVYWCKMVLQEPRPQQLLDAYGLKTKFGDIDIK